MIDHRRKSLSDLWDVLGCQTRCCGGIASREAWATYVSTDYFGIPHNTPSLALKFAISYSFQMQSGIWNNSFCFLTGNFFPTSYTLLGYFEVTWQLTMKLFPAKIFERATPQNLWCQSVTVLCYPRMLTDDHRYSKVSWISSYNKSLKDRSLGKQLIMLPLNLNVSELWDSQETKLTVSFRTSH